MPDYGHDLRFGLFPTPAASAPDHVLELAQLAEVSGLDLVAVQDHPYQAAHLDALTLLSVIGARTTTITVAPDVASLPLRPPVVLAGWAASLDLLTGGRVELGLGAGAFWDAIVAAGGPRRTPGEAVDALVEAVAVIRACWAGGSVRLDGDHYAVRGLRAGPVPSRPLPLWLGAYGPRMLRVTADVADAWIPSMGYTDPPALGDLNARIDERATANGRGPQAVRRMYNVVGRFGTGRDFLQGTPADWAEQLAGLALDEGIGTFVLGTDSPDDVRRFATEVAPAVREQVEAERALRSGAAAPPVEPPLPVELVETRPAADDGANDGAWDESTRPRYPVPPGATYTPQGLATARHLVEVHDALRAELDQLRDVVDQVRRGLLQVGQARSTINTMTMRQNNWTLGAYCESYCRIVTGHHTLEDRSMLPHLASRDPASVPVVERLEAEHHVIHDVLERVDQRLVALVSAAPRDASAALEALSSEVDRLTDTLLSHLRYEETELHHPLAVHGMVGA
ncbi:LLM class flavin-dependent oxidoreductase [Nocardioides aequoreus]|uniref:LLM class flavin-dependent oxidoreductase n=1 Tax=Nocardioides aequoreus TaxID=397278 RepID=UPI0004C3E1CB|nr:LLM class flavin-dependent oxidoreductase [Nocardioides aequoreus]